MRYSLYYTTRFGIYAFIYFLIIMASIFMLEKSPLGGDTGKNEFASILMSFHRFAVMLPIIPALNKVLFKKYKHFRIVYFKKDVSIFAVICLVLCLWMMPPLDILWAALWQGVGLLIFMLFLIFEWSLGASVPFVEIINLSVVPWGDDIIRLSIPLITGLVVCYALSAIALSCIIKNGAIIVDNEGTVKKYGVKPLLQEDKSCFNRYKLNYVSYFFVMFYVYSISAGLILIILLGGRSCRLHDSLKLLVKILNNPASLDISTMSIFDVCAIFSMCCLALISLFYATKQAINETFQRNYKKFKLILNNGKVSLKSTLYLYFVFIIPNAFWYSVVFTRESWYDEVYFWLIVTKSLPLIVAEILVLPFIVPYIARKESVAYKRSEEASETN